MSSEQIESGDSMLTLRPITSENGNLEEVRRLYTAAFPAVERRPLEPLLAGGQDYVETLGFYTGEQFIGFACLLFAGDIAHLIYFATEEALRNRGYGSSALTAMGERYPGRRIIADLEKVRPDLPEAANALRARRRNFYLRNGFAPTEVTYRWRGELYEILARGGAVTNAEFDGFWKTIDGKLAGY